MRLQTILSIPNDDISEGLAGGGNGTKARGNFSFAFGDNVGTVAPNQIIFGKNGELNSNSLFAIADGLDSFNKSLAFEIGKNEDKYTIKINNIDLYDSIIANSENISKNAEDIDNLQAEIESLNHTSTNCLKPDDIIEETKVSFGANDIYSASYTQKLINDLDGRLNQLIVFDNSNEKQLLKQLSIINLNSTAGTKTLAVTIDGEQGVTTLAPKAYVDDLIRDLSTTQIFALAKNYDKDNDYEAATCAIINEAIDTELADKIHEQMQTVPGEIVSYADVPYALFNNMGILAGTNYNETKNGKPVIFAIGDGSGNHDLHNLFCINTEGVYFNDQELVLKNELNTKVERNNNEPLNILYGPIDTPKSSIEWSDNLTLQSGINNIILQNTIPQLKLSNLSVKGIVVPENPDDDMAINVLYLKNYINPNGKMDKFGSVELINNKYSISSNGLTINQINFDTAQISGLNDLNSESDLSSAANKKYVDEQIKIVYDLANTKQNNFATENRNGEELISARFNIPIYIGETVAFEDDEAIVNKKYIINQISNMIQTKQDVFASINIDTGTITLNSEATIINNLKLPDITEQSDGNSAINKNYVDNIVGDINQVLQTLVTID